MSTELTAATNPGSRALGARGVQPATIAELVQWAEFVVKSGICPRGIDTKEKVIIAIQHVMELGLPIQGGLQSCMVVNNRVSLWGEMVIGIIQAHPEFEDMDVSYEGKGDEFTCLVTIKRKGQTPWTGKFSIGQARNAGLLTDPNKKATWGKYEEDMLFWRAFSRAKRIFSDVLKGVKMPHEIQDEDRGLGFDNARNVTPAPAKPELTEPADKTSARAELKKAREQVEKESAAAAAPQTIFHTGGPAPAPATKVVGDSPEAGPF